MKKKALLSWSSGKDSAWALHNLQQNPEWEIEGLFCTVNKKFDRVAMHGVRRELLERQAEHIGLPLDIIEIPYPCSNEKYEQIMNVFVGQAKRKKIRYFVFGDIFLEDVRKYREDHLSGTGITPFFPLWEQDTHLLSREMINNGLKSVVVCLDPKQTPENFAGRIFDENFLNALPQGIDPCGENGEFHTFVYDGPMFANPVRFEIGKTVERDGFVFTDIL